jgi:phosphatidylserine/phosphatidylglycerophosphate/cardiolipin synthase-like enzyme
MSYLAQGLLSLAATMGRNLLAAFAPSLLLFAAACPSPADDEGGDGENDSFAIGKADGGVDPESDEAKAVLLVVNDLELDFTAFDDVVKLDRRAAEGIIEHRDGPDGEPGTEDDDLFDDLEELDEVKFVAQTAFDALLKYAITEGYLDRVRDTGPMMTDVVFSPQPSEQSHNARVASLIDGARETIDVAMYSFSNASVRTALQSAAERGVEIRFLFETANDDRKLEGEALLDSASGQLEEHDIDVRWVNKIMHHKFMIIDGPRDDLSRATTAMVATGSANWSNSAATRYDENTLFLRGHEELTLRLQQEFNHLWHHSRDFVANEAIEFSPSGVEIGEEDIPDGPDEHAFFTSDNFDIKDGDDTFRITGRNRVSDQLIAAIQNADESIFVASGHLRHRGISEAIMAKLEEDPELDVRIYLDAQEYISEFTHDDQVDELEECLAEANTESQRRNCLDKGFLFGFVIGEAGAHVRYKWYAYRWHFTYAAQMHHKYLIIDGDELWTGSYNLSDNAEHNTFENMLHFTGESSRELIDTYEANFEAIWETGRAEDLLSDLRDEIETSDVIPMVFDPMALEHEEVRALKSLILDNCTQANSTDFRQHPDRHLVCERD